MNAAFQMTCVAFVRSTGGRVSLLLAVDREGERLFGGEPVLLVEHRPGRGAATVTIEGPDTMPAATCELVAERAGPRLAGMVELAHDADGTFDGQRLVGARLDVELPHGLFDA